MENLLAAADTGFVIQGIFGIVLFVIGFAFLVAVFAMPFYVYSIKRDMNTLVKHMEQNNELMTQLNAETNKVVQGVWMMKNHIKSNSPS